MLTLLLVALFGFTVGYAMIGPVNKQDYTPMQAFMIILALVGALGAGLLTALTVGALFAGTTSTSGLGGVAIAYGGALFYALFTATGVGLRVWRDDRHG